MMSSMLHTATWLRRAGYQYCTGTPFGLRNFGWYFLQKNSFFNGYTMLLTTKLGSVAPAGSSINSNSRAAVAVSTQVQKKELVLLHAGTGDRSVSLTADPLPWPLPGHGNRPTHVSDHSPVTQ